VNRRRYAILASGEFAGRAAKTAHGVIAYGSDEVVAVIDAEHAGKRVREVVPILNSDVPIVADFAEALDFSPDALLIGVAPAGGALPAAWRATIVTSLEAGLEVVSGLHQILAEDPEFTAAAARGGGSIWDVRLAPEVPLFSGEAYRVESRVVLMVGTDCAVGKMTVALELTRAALLHGESARFVATGQTGIMIAGDGIAIDRIISDFATGAAERLVVEHAPGADVLFVEGQGGINNPAFAPVTLALLFGAAPDALVLVHRPSRKVVDELGTPLLSYRAAIRTYEALCATVKPAKVVGIALNTGDLDAVSARAEIERAQTETGLPVDDVVRFGPDALYVALAPEFATKGVPLAEPVPR
jgi:uncharacterized NAD-dependent epimerase/dehydratase family protein